MNKQEFKQQILKIQTAYDKQFTQEELRMWYEEFKTTEIEEFSKAIDKTIQEVKFIPKIANLRARIKINPTDYYIRDTKKGLYKNLEWGNFVN